MGLNNPRGLAFGPGHRLYVAESGYGGDGPCVFNPEPNQPERCYGETGAVVQIDLWSGKGASANWKRVLTGLPSLAVHDNPATPANESGSRASGPVDIVFVGREAFVLMAWGGDPANRAAHLGELGKLFGTLLDVELEGIHSWGGHGFDHRWQRRKWRVVADIAAHERAHNPDAAFNTLPPDSNPNGLAVLPFRFLVADSGANTVVEVPWWRGGRTRTFGVLPPRCVGLPPMTPPGPGPGPAVGCAAGEWKVQSVPTSVARGPDWAVYVGELTGFPFPEGAARVHRVMPWGGESNPHFEGFTNVIDVAFDAWGNAYVLEIGHRLVFGSPAAPFSPATGRLIKVDVSTSVRTTLASALIFPAGVDIGPDGNAYVTEFGTTQGAGRVLRIDLP